MRLVMGNARHEDPLLRLFGSQASRGSKAVANFKESGVMVFGEVSASTADQMMCNNCRKTRQIPSAVAVK